MGLIRVNYLRDLQEDLRWPLLADEFFSDLGVIDYYAHELETEIDRQLTTITEKNSKCGAGVVVMPITAVDTFTDASARHPLKVQITYLVLEVPAINRGDAGTGKSALAIAERIRQVMKHYTCGGFATPLVPDSPTFQVVEDPIAPVALEVRFTCYAGVDQALDKCATVVTDYDSVTGLLTLTCGTPDVTIYYTLDASFPYTGAGATNAAATVYSTPILLEGEWVVRAAAFKAGFTPGNVSLLRSTDIGDQTGDDGSLGGLN